MNKSQQRCSPLFVINIKQMLKQTYHNNNKQKIHISNNVTQPFLRMSLSQRSQRSYRKENYLIKKAVNSNNNTIRSTLHKGNEIDINHKTKQSTILSSSKSNNKTLLGEYKSFNINNSSKINKCNVFRTNMKGNVIQDLINVTNNREKCLHNSNSGNKICVSVENKSNKSLFLYTALIFLVALLMIVISFFGQSHLEGARATEQKAKTITERASALSDENLHLTEQVLSLTESLEIKDGLIVEHQETINSQIAEKTNMDSLLRAFRKAREKRRTEAREILETVNTELLTEDGKYLYNYVSAQLK
jgi:hypothetical protein